MMLDRGLPEAEIFRHYVCIFANLGHGVVGLEVSRVKLCPVVLIISYRGLRTDRDAAQRLVDSTFLK